MRHYKTLPDVRKQPAKTANMEMLTMGALVAALASRLGMSIPQVERMRNESPSMYAALIGLVSLIGADALTPNKEPLQEEHQPGALIPPGFLV